MKISQINVVHSTGSTGKITGDLHRELLARGHESKVLYGRGDASSDAAIIKTSTELDARWNALRSRVVGMPYDGSKKSTDRIIDELQTQRPDIVHLQCLNGHFVNIYRLIEYLRQKRQPVVLTLHAEFMFTGGCGHSFDCDRWRLSPGCGSCPQLRQATESWFLDRTREGWERMYEAFANFHDRLVITSVSPWLQSRAESSPILGRHKHVTVLNGIDTEVFRPRSHAKMRRLLNCPNPQRTLLHVTPYFTTEGGSLKGGRDIVELAERLGSGYRVIVVGRTARLGAVPPNMTLVGRIDVPEELAAIYSMSTATILTSRRETFSMVCAESLACGTPVVGYKAGGPEQVALPQYSSFVEQGDLGALTEAIRETCASTPVGREADDLAQAMHAAAHEAYSTTRMVDQFEGLYNCLVGTGG